MQQGLTSKAQSQTTASSPASVDSSFYLTNPAPAPAVCPNGFSEATLSEELEEGPYYVDENLLRSNVTEDQLGLPLEIKITILDTSCNPVADAFVDIWMCNATGIYSGYLASQQDAGGNTYSRKLLQTGTDNSTFLRGTTITDDNGVATFYSIFPGWYAGRAVHVHTMVHLPEGSLSDSDEEDVYSNSSYIVHTGRIFFEDSVLDSVYSLYPYTRHTGTVTLVEEDDTYTGDERTLMTLTNVNGFDLTDGLVGSVVQIINTTAHYTEGETNQGMGSGMALPGDSGSSMGPGTYNAGGMGPMPSGGSFQGSGGIAGSPSDSLNGGPVGGTQEMELMLNLPPATGRKLMGSM